MYDFYLKCGCADGSLSRSHDLVSIFQNQNKLTYFKVVLY